MSSFKIHGGTPLFGSVRLGGAKNASYKLMIASMLGDTESRLLNFSHIEDVQITRDIIESLGGKTKDAGERMVFIDTSSLDTQVIPDEFGPKSRASTMFIPVLLHRFGKASVPYPGGDNIGKRPLDRHFDGLKAMGAQISQDQERIEVEAKELKGTTYKFTKNSHTGTETLIMAGAKAKGKTVLENAALEPEIDDLIEFLNNMGAQIRRRPGRIIEINGVKNLHPAIHRIMPDRNEAVSYACAALVTKGDIIVENANPDHLDAFLAKLDEIKAGYEIGNYGVRFFYKGPLQATDMTTQKHPGFMTDWQPLWTVLMTQAKGESMVHETIFPNRFQHVDGLNKLGANIELVEIPVDDKEETYNFYHDEETKNVKHGLKITGPSNLKGGRWHIHDLRSGATMVLAALSSNNMTILDNIEQIDRGYESFDDRLRSMGAKIERM